MKQSTRKKKVAKRVLRLPDLDFAKRAVLNTLGSSDSKRAYEFAIDHFVAWYCSQPRLASAQARPVDCRASLRAGAGSSAGRAAAAPAQPSSEPSPACRPGCPLWGVTIFSRPCLMRL